jgi:hypothetical protein
VQLLEEFRVGATKAQALDTSLDSKKVVDRAAALDLPLRVRRRRDWLSKPTCCCASVGQCIFEPRRRYQFQTHSFSHAKYRHREGATTQKQKCVRN